MFERTGCPERGVREFNRIHAFSPQQHFRALEDTGADVEVEPGEVADAIIVAPASELLSATKQQFTGNAAIVENLAFDNDAKPFACGRLAARKVVAQVGDAAVQRLSLVLEMADAGAQAILRVEMRSAQPRQAQ